VAVAAVIDGTLSSLLTCHPVGAQTGSGANEQQAKENCTALSGPVLTTLGWIAAVTHKYEGLITAAFTVVLAVFTGRLWYSTDNLWKATTELVRGAEDTAQRQLRAYVGVTVPDSELRYPDQSLQSSDPSIFKIALEIRNSGQTPA
jgi:hypothetical protein